MIDPELNKQALAELDARIGSLDTIISDPSTSSVAKADATQARAALQQEKALRNKVAAAKTPAEQTKAEADLAAYRKKNCPGSEESGSTMKCRPSPLFVHLHMRFLLPKQLLTDMRDPAKYPLRAANCSLDTFKKYFSFEGLPITSKRRWNHNPVVKATVTLNGKTATTNPQGTARFDDIPAGTYTLEITPPPGQSTTLPAGPDLPVASGYSFDSAPNYLYRPFSVRITVDGEGHWSTATEPTVTLPHGGQRAAHAGVAGVVGMDLYLDWKPDWLKVLNRRVIAGRTNQAVVIHCTATTNHERVGSPIDTFYNGPKKTAAHYLVDLDGHIIKLVHEEEQARHANSASHWHELADLDRHGIGIETVHADYNSETDRKLREYTTEQYTAINSLLTALSARFDISAAYVCGHNDCRDGARECPGDMFDWKSIEDAGNALKTLRDGAFSGSRVVVSGAQTADDPAVPVSRELFKIGYTAKTVATALERFLLRAWSGSRLAARPKTALEPVPLPTDKPKPKTPPAPAVQVTQVVADAVDQMYRDLPQ